MLSGLPRSPLVRGLAAFLAAMLLAPGLVLAQTDQGGAANPFKPEELDQLVAPIALYPDPLVAQILMASTYPLEIVQAARFAKANANLKGDQLNEALKKQTWDDSVKSLLSFPQVLTMMNEKLDWTQNLGDAFLGGEKDVMDAVQRLRAKAQAAGNLKSTAEQTVTTEPAPPGQTSPPQIIYIQPANPQVIYQPIYNPAVVYGPWPYPAYPPYPPYYPPGYVAGTAILSFGIGMAAGAAIWGNCNWGGGDVDVNVNNYNNYTKNVNTGDIANKRAEQYQGNRGQGGRGQGQGQWQHNPEHRKGAQYRDASTQQRFNKAGPGNAQSREAYRGQQGAQGGPRASQGAVGGGQAGGAPRASQGAVGGGQAGGGQAARSPGAFEGVGEGRATSMDSARGQSSRESFGASTAERGGGGGGNVQRGGGGGGGGRGGGGGGGGGGGRGGGGGGRRR